MKKMARTIALALTLILTLALFTACGTPAATVTPTTAPTGTPDASGEKLVIGFSIMTVTNNSFNKNIADAARKVIEDAGHEFHFVAAGTGETATIEQQAKDIEDMINMGVDGIIVDPMDENALIPALQKAKDAGIPVVICSLTVAPGNEDLYVTTVSSDFKNSGKAAAQMAKEALPDGGSVVIVRGASGSAAGEDEADGFVEELEGSNITVVNQQYGNYANDQAMKVTENMIQANPEIVGLFTVSDIMYPGIASALENAGMTEQVLIFGHDGFAVAADAIRAGYQYSTNLLRPVEVGAECAEIILQAVSGTLPADYPKFIDKGVTVVTKENVEDYVDSYM